MDKVIQQIEQLLPELRAVSKENLLKHHKVARFNHLVRQLGEESRRINILALDLVLKACEYKGEGTKPNV